MVSVDLTIRNKKKEAKRYEAYLKKCVKCGRCAAIRSGSAEVQ